MNISELIPLIYRESYAKLLFTDYIDEVVYSGGRGSLKSTIASLEAVTSVMTSDGDSAICFRRYANGLRNSVYSDCLQAIDRLNVSEYWDTKLSPLELIYKPNGGKILFRGMDDEQKIKGIKLHKGQFIFAWFEELQEVENKRKLRSIVQSVARGEKITKIVYTYNPPQSPLHWVNKEMETEDEKVLNLHTTYLDVPQEWLGPKFVRLAEQLKVNNIDAYENEYLGRAVGAEGMVFKNIKVAKNIEDMSFKTLYRGVDFGFAADPATYVVWGYNKKEHSITALYEFYGKGINNKSLSEEIHMENKHKFTVRCDNAEPKSIAELVKYKVKAVPCTKGRDSVRFGIKWLQGLNSIYIDPDLTPNIYKEFTEYQYLIRKGVATGEYPDKDNHTIDATRYALELKILEV